MFQSESVWLCFISGWNLIPAYLYLLYRSYPHQRYNTSSFYCLCMYYFALVLHDLLELSPRARISIEYSRRYFNWFVGKFRRQVFALNEKWKRTRTLRSIQISFLTAGCRTWTSPPHHLCSLYPGRRRPERHKYIRSQFSASRFAPSMSEVCRSSQGRSAYEKY